MQEFLQWNYFHLSVYIRAKAFCFFCTNFQRTSEEACLFTENSNIFNCLHYSFLNFHHSGKQQIDWKKIKGKEEMPCANMFSHLSFTLLLFLSKVMLLQEIILQLGGKEARQRPAYKGGGRDAQPLGLKRSLNSLVIIILITYL